MYRGKGKKNFFKNMKKRVQSALLDSPGRYTGNNFLFKGGLIYDIYIRVEVIRNGEMRWNDAAMRKFAVGISFCTA